jgi:hypothetical protein
MTDTSWNLTLARLTLPGLLLPALLPGAALAETRAETFRVAPQGESVVRSGTVQGAQIVDYRFSGCAGQLLKADLYTDNTATFIDILQPASPAVVFSGAAAGDGARVQLTENGLHTVRVYLARNAAGTAQISQYELIMDLSSCPASAQAQGAAPAAPARSGNAATSPGNAPDSLSASAGKVATAPAGTSLFNQTLSYNGYRFQVNVSADADGNVLTLLPVELGIAPVTRTLTSTVTGAEIADLNSDGLPEVYIYAHTPDSAAHGELYAFALQPSRQLVEIYLRPITDNQAASPGYRGHDTFAILNNTLAQRFPVYDSTSTTPSGRVRQLHYTLVPGESFWRLQLDELMEY